MAPTRPQVRALPVSLADLLVFLSPAAPTVGHWSALGTRSTPHRSCFIIVRESGHYCHIEAHFLTVPISRSQGSPKIKSGPLYQQAWCSLPAMVHARLSPRLSDETDPDKSHQQLRFARRRPAGCAWYRFIPRASDSLSNFARHVARVWYLPIETPSAAQINSRLDC